MSIKKGLTSIADEIFGDIEKEAEKAVREAEKEAEDILKRAEEEAEKTRRELLAQARRRGEVEKRRIEASTEMETRSRLLQAKEELVEATFRKTLNSLEDYTKTEGYRDYLLKLIADTAENFESDRIIIYVNPKDSQWLSQEGIEKLPEKLRNRLALADKSEDCVGGFILKSSDKRLSYDNTFENRLERLKPILRMRIAALLLEEEG